MSVVVLLILASLAVALLFLSGFIWAVRSGQYEDTTTPSMRVLADEPKSQISETNSNRNEHEHRNLQI
jgi:cbb3-type cytochrome oxidase maturation protein